MGLFLAHRRHLPRLPWIVFGGATLAGLAAHFAVAGHHTVAGGKEAKFIGTGTGVGSILHMVDWVLPNPEVIGLVIWIVALVYLARHPGYWLLWPILLIPLAGFVADRPYWGLMFEPFMILLATEAVIDLVLRARAPART